MKKNVTYEDWKRLFQKETGYSVDEARYTPAHPIDVPVYLDQESSSHSRPEKGITQEKELKISHTLIIDQNTNRFVMESIEMLRPYRISEILTLDFTNKDKDTLVSIWNSVSVSSINPTHLAPGTPFYLDFHKARNDLSTVKKWRDEALADNREIWYSPEDDFLWNVGMTRGLHYYFSEHHPEYWIKKVPAVYINLKEMAHNENESQLIQLTNILLSMASAGIRDFVWNIREMTTWQKDHFHLLLNIPEILSRESRLYDYGDAVHGSGFFEALPDKISQYLAE